MKDSKTSAQNAQCYPLLYEGANLHTTDLDLCTKCTKSKYHQVTGLFIRTYMTEDNLVSFLRDTNPESFAYILHDKEGEPHFHLLAYYPHRVRISTLARYTNGQQTMVLTPRSYSGSYEYLTHAKQPKKHQYNSADIVGHNTIFFTQTAQERDEANMEQFLDDLANLPRRAMAIKYGKDYIRNYRKYTEFDYMLKADDIQNDLQNIEDTINDEYSILAEYGVSYADVGSKTLIDFFDYAKKHYDPSRPLTPKVLGELFGVFDRIHAEVRKHYVLEAIRRTDLPEIQEETLVNDIKRRCKW